MSNTNLVVVDYTADEGSLICINKSVSREQIDESHSKLTKIERTTLEFIIDSRSLVNEQQLISVRQLGIELGLKDHTFRQRVRNLYSKRFLRRIPFTYADCSSQSKVACYELVTAPERAELVVQESSPKNPPALPGWKKALIKSGFAPIPKVTTANTPVLRHAEQTLQSAVEQVVNQNQRVRGKPLTHDVQNSSGYTRPFLLNGQRMNTLVSSKTHIMDFADLQVLYAVHSLIHKYHREQVLSGDISQVRNLTPIYIDDVLKVLQRAKTGPNFHYVRDCLYAIKDTTFDFSSIRNIAVPDGNLYGEIKGEYKNFTYFSPFHPTGPDGTTKGNTLAKNHLECNASVYLITVPEVIFKSLTRGERLFSFPKMVLSIPSIFFAVYLRCRVLNIGDALYQEELSRTFSSLNKVYARELSKAYSILKSRKIYDDNFGITYNEVTRTYTLNMWGYNVVIDLVNEIMSAICDVELMIKCSNADNPNAPTIFNDMAVLTQEYDALDQPYRFRKLMGVKTLFRQHTICLHIRDAEHENVHELTLYCDEDDVSSIANLISIKSLCTVSEAKNYVMHQLERTIPVTVRDVDLTKGDFDHLLSLSDDKHIDDWVRCIAIRRLRRRKSIHQDVIDYVIDGKEPSKELISSIKEFSNAAKRERKFTFNSTASNEEANSVPRLGYSQN